MSVKLRLVSVADALKLGEKEIIPSITGTVTECYPRKAGEGAKGPWTVQTFVISQGDDSIRVSAWNHPDLTLKGKRITVSCKTGDKGNTGVYASIDTYKGKSTPAIKLTDTAIITVEGAQQVSQQTGPAQSQWKSRQVDSDILPSASEHDAYDPNDTSEPPPEHGSSAGASRIVRTPAPTPSPTPVKNGNHAIGVPRGGVKEVKVAMNRYANTWAMAYGAAVYAKQQVDAIHGASVGEVSEDQFQAMVSSLFIQACKGDQIMPQGTFSEIIG